MQVGKITDISFKGAVWNKNDPTTKYILNTLSKEHKQQADVLETYLNCMSDTYKQNVVIGFKRPKANPDSVALYALIEDKKHRDVKILAAMKAIREQFLTIDGIAGDYFDNFQKEAVIKMDECKNIAFDKELSDIRK